MVVGSLPSLFAQPLFDRPAAFQTASLSRSADVSCLYFPIPAFYCKGLHLILELAKLLDEINQLIGILSTIVKNAKNN